MIPYIGDISKADAELLADFALEANSILEFGCGASTQVLAANTQGLMLSIDTDLGWIEKTRKNLELLEITNEDVHFREYSTFMQADTKGPFDLVFVDGVDNLRRQFAIDIWPYLKIDGVMAFHDTRRAHDFRNVLEVMAQFQNEIEAAVFNMSGSNISILVKKVPEPYDNWQITENKQPWQLGYGDVPPEEVDKIKSLLKQKS